MTDRETSSSGQLLVEREGPILTLTLNRPERKNALSLEMLGRLTEELREAVLGDVTRVVVLGGAGEHFCSGIDLGESNASPGGGRPRTGHIQRRMHLTAHTMIRMLHELQLPVVAGVRGWAAGIGNAVALSADVTVAAPSARFWVPFVPRGFSPDSGTTYLLPRLIGLARAKEMILRGRAVDGERAAEWGLVSELAPEDGLDAAVEGVAEELASAPTIAVGLSKTLIHRNLDGDLTSALQNEAVYEEVAVRSDDFKEGMRAFAERRDPEYRGR